MELVIFTLLSALGGLTFGFIFGCSHEGLFVGLFKGCFFGALLAAGLHLLGGFALYCWCLFGTCVLGCIIATLTSNEHWLKRPFDLRRPLDL
ncbi:MAG: hypothetical protein ACRD3W_22515 [Terriglobales bacterium]